MGTSKKTTTALIAALTTTIPTIASPQGGAGASGGLQVDFGVSSSLKADDNFQLNPVTKGNSTIWDNTLTFGITSQSQTQRLALTGSTVLRFSEIPGRSISGLEDPNLRLSYTLDAANSRLVFDGRYRRADREFLNPFQVEQEEQQFGSLVGDGGTQTDRSARLTFDTGLNDPIGFTFTLGHVEKRFAGVVNPTLFDTQTDNAGLTTRFTVSPVTRVTLNLGETWYEADDTLQTRRDTSNVSVGLQQDITQTLVFDGSIGFSDINTEQLGITSSRSGGTGRISLVQTFQNGTASVDLNTSQNQNGARTTLTFGRQLQLARGNLSASLGLTEGPGTGIDWIANVNYSSQLKSSSFNVGLRRAASTNNQNAEIVDTRINLGYSHDIDNISRINLNFDYGRTEDGGTGTTPTVERANLRAAYSRQITQDWNLQGGVLLRYIDDRAAAGAADSKSLFLTLDRNFSFRP